jgi:hypothetical protein
MCLFPETEAGIDTVHHHHILLLVIQWYINTVGPLVS